MKFTCFQKKLSDSIIIAQKAITPRTTLPILEGILMTTYKGVLKLVGTDLNLGIECFLEANIIEEGAVVVPSRIFGDIIRKMPNSMIEVEVDSNYRISIKTENSHFTIQGVKPDEYPELKYVEERDPIEIQQNLLKEMIQNTIFAVATDETRPILTGALFEVKEDNINIVCLDGYRLALKRGMVANNKNISVIIPGKTLSEVSRIIDNSDDKISITVDEKHVLFDMGYIRIVSRLLVGEFLNYTQIIPQEHKTRIRADIGTLYDAIERASLLAREGKNNLIKLTLKEDRLIINSNSEVGAAHEEVPITLEGNEMTIAFNSRYFMDILKAVGDEEVCIDFTTNVSPCVFRPEDGDNFTYLLLPVRTSV
ncbi:MAG: DNA polymerase III subunit beta [Clostridiales bacterium]|nr:DNA polymerase III subunit beta [Clostridiales bacterium]